MQNGAGGTYKKRVYWGVKQEQEKAAVRFMGQKACYTENSERNCFLQKKEGFLNGIHHGI